MNAPAYAFCNILNGHKWQPQKMLIFYEHAILTLHCCQSLYQPMAPPKGHPESPCDIIAYELVLQFMNLLQNLATMIPKKLVIDINNPLSHYKPCCNKCLGKAITGSIYKQACNCLKSDASHQFLFLSSNNGLIKHLSGAIRGFH
jgi:hypothetical protein